MLAPLLGIERLERVSRLLQEPGIVDRLIERIDQRLKRAPDRRLYSENVTMDHATPAARLFLLVASAIIILMVVLAQRGVSFTSGVSPA
jgi:hypothetical protein